MDAGEGPSGTVMQGIACCVAWVGSVLLSDSVRRYKQRVEETRGRGRSEEKR